jgi:hypothetical protein
MSNTTPLSAGEIEEARETVEGYRQEFGDLDAALDVLHPAPLAPDLAEAVKHMDGEIESRDRHVPGSFTITVEIAHLRTLLRHARAQQLAQKEAVREAEAALEMEKCYCQSCGEQLDTGWECISERWRPNW